MRILFVALLLTLSFSLNAATEAAAGPAEGEAVFKSKCKACHKFGGKVMGPDLAGIGQRATAEWLTKWLTDTKGTFAGDDPYTIDMKKRAKSKKKPKHRTKKLTEADISNVIDLLMTK